MPKVDIGKEAILRAVAALTERDEFGVVAFNENAHWAIHTAPLGQIGDVESQIAGIRPEGQTNIFAGLSEAVASLEQTSATRRHIVLFTDGWSSSGEYDDLIRRMAAAGITLSTVGAGGGGANDFLSGLAQRGGGRYYAATDPATIPDIFLKETQQVSGQQIVEETFFPILTSVSPILNGLEDGIPQLRGYNGTTAKAAAQTVLVSTRDDPVLAQWQYGLGRSVAWTSDAQGRWAANWVGWSGFNQFFSQLVSWTFPGEESGGMEAEFITEGDRTRLQLRSVESDGTPRNFYDSQVNITDPNFDLAEGVRLDQIAPGVYETDLGQLTPGAYALRFVQTKPGETPLARTVMLIAPTPAEYRLLGTNERLLCGLAGRDRRRSAGIRRAGVGPRPGHERPRRRTCCRGCCCWRCCCGRWTWPCGDSRSRGPTSRWPVPGRRRAGGHGADQPAGRPRWARCSRPLAAPVAPSHVPPCCGRKSQPVRRRVRLLRRRQPPRPVAPPKLSEPPSAHS